MKIKLNKQESIEYFHNALCNGLQQVHQYGISVDYDLDEYARAKLKVNQPPGYEDVLIQILKDGGVLKIEDSENGETAFIDIKNVYSRINNTPVKHIMDTALGYDDADTADAILQTVFFNEIVYG